MMATYPRDPPNRKQWKIKPEKECVKPLVEKWSTLEVEKSTCSESDLSSLTKSTCHIFSFADSHMCWVPSLVDWNHFLLCMQLFLFLGKFRPSDLSLCLFCPDYHCKSFSWVQRSAPEDSTPWQNLWSNGYNFLERSRRRTCKYCLKKISHM